MDNYSQFNLANQSEMTLSNENTNQPNESGGYSGVAVTYQSSNEIYDMNQEQPIDNYSNDMVEISAPSAPT